MIREHAVLAAAIFNIICTNDIVSGLMLDAHWKLKKSELYKRRVKQMANRIEDARLRYERKVASVLKDTIGLFAESNDAYNDDDLQKSIQVLYYSMKSEMDKKRVEHSDLLAQMELARTMLDYSVRQFEMRCKDLKKVGRHDVLKRLDFLNLTGVFKMYENLMALMTVGCVVDMNTDVCFKALDIVVRKLVDGERIAKAIDVVTND